MCAFALKGFSFPSLMYLSPCLSQMPGLTRRMSQITLTRPLPTILCTPSRGPRPTQPVMQHHMGLPARPLSMSTGPPRPPPGTWPSTDLSSPRPRLRPRPRRGPRPRHRWLQQISGEWALLIRQLPFTLAFESCCRMWEGF